jgi:hypothetical protein
MLEEHKLITHLQDKYNPEIILLGGSRAKNTERVDSDWDIYLIGDYKIENEQVSEEFLGEHLDIALFPKFCLKDKVLRLFYGPVSDVKVLFDNEDNFGFQIVEATKEAYLNKPNSLTPAQILEKTSYLNRILSKIEGYKDKPEVSFFHLAQFYQIAIPFWFEFHSKWSMPVQYALPIIESVDPMFYNLLNSIITTTKVEEQIIGCKKILEHFKKEVNK